MAKKYNDGELKQALDLIAKKLKPLVDKVADAFGIQIGYEINWILKEDEKNSLEK